MMRLLLCAAFVLAALHPACRAQQGQEPPPQAAPVAPPSAAKSLVAYALLPSAVEGGVVREAMVARMVDAVVMSVAKKPDIASAWRVFVGPKDRVGIKVCTSGAPVSSTHPAVVSAVAAGLVASGVDPKNIVIWDRSARDIALAGYEKLSRHYRVTSTESAGGYDPEAKFVSAIMGRLIVGDVQFGSKPGDQMSSTSHLSRVLGKEVDKVVNVPSLSDSIYSGVQGAFSSMVTDNLDNWRRLAREPHFGDPYLPELYADPRIGGKVVLTIVDALRPQYAGGPFPGAEFTVNYGAVFASRDPVALDATGMRLLDDFRKEAKFDPIAKKTKWPESAEVLGLGNAADDKIGLVRTGLEGEVRMQKSP